MPRKISAAERLSGITCHLLAKCHPFWKSAQMLDILVICSLTTSEQKDLRLISHRMPSVTVSRSWTAGSCRMHLYGWLVMQLICHSKVALCVLCLHFRR